MNNILSASHSAHYIAVFSICLVASHAMCARADTAPAPNTDLDYLVAAMRSNRDKLISGICTIQGRDRNGEYRARQVFDGRKVRYDRDGMTYVQSVSEATRTAPPTAVRNQDSQPVFPLKLARATQQFADDGTVVATWQQDSGGVTLWRSQSFLGRDAVGYRDIRGTGLVPDPRTADQFDYRQILDSVNKVWAKNGRVIREDGKWILAYSWTHPNNARSELRYEIDEAKGFGPIRYLDRGFRPAGAPSSDKEVVDNDESTEWAQVAGVWVPVRNRRVGRDGIVEWEATIQWESVNQPIDPLEFSYKGFGLPPGQVVSDFTSGGDYGTIIREPAPAGRLRPAGGGSRNLVLLLTALGFTCLAVAMLRVRRRLRAAEGGAT